MSSCVCYDLNPVDPTKSSDRHFLIKNLVVFRMEENSILYILHTAYFIVHNTCCKNSMNSVMECYSKHIWYLYTQFLMKLAIFSDLVWLTDMIKTIVIWYSILLDILVWIFYLYISYNISSDCVHQGLNCTTGHQMDGTVDINVTQDVKDIEIAVSVNIAIFICNTYLKHYI